MMRTSQLSWLTIVFTAVPCAAQIDDRAELFSGHARDKAEARIRDVREKTGKQIMILTLAHAPDEFKKQFNLDDTGQLKEAFDKYARERMAKANADGICLLICQDPQHIQVIVTKDTESLFGKWYQDHLRGRMISRFQPDNPEQHFFSALRNKLRSGSNPSAGLLETIDYINAKLDYNRPVDQTNLYLGLAIMGSMIAVWLILGIVRARLRKTTPADAGVHGADDSGRSIAVLGGGIGAVSGQWFFSHFFGRRPPAGPPHVAVDGLPPPHAEDIHG
jgi:uncharacterized membrane protein YgcG